MTQHFSPARGCMIYCLLVMLSACKGSRFRQEIDETPPRSPAVEVTGAILLIRTPGGLSTRSSSVTMTITGGPGATEPHTRLRVYDLEDNRLAEVETDDQGSFPPITLSTRDQTTLKVSSVDDSNNESNPQRIQEVRWQPILSSAPTPNPIEVTVVPHRNGAQALGLRPEAYRLPSEQWSHLSASDDRVVTLKEQRLWQKVPYLTSTEGQGPLRGQVAYDRRRGRAVSVCNADNETWEWNGLQWEKQQPLNHPEARVSCGLVFDARHDRTLIFGGYGPQTDTQFGELWAWDGIDWKEILPSNSPSPRASPMMAYHPHDGRVLLFGGTDRAENRDLNDFWALDGDTWHEISPPNESKPPACSNGTMNYDPHHRQLVLHCDRSPKTWVWNDIQWTAHDSPLELQHCENSTMVYDESRQQLILWGCQEEYSNILPWWGWNGAQWEFIHEVEDPQEVSQLAQSQLVFDTKDHQILAFNSWEVWVLDGVLWRSRTPSVKHPSRRVHSSAAYDPDRQRTVLFGGKFPLVEGSTITESLNDTWVFQGRSWRSMTTPPNLIPRYSAGFAYDIDNERFVLTGGLHRMVNPQQGLVIRDVWHLRHETWEFQGEIQPENCVRAYHQLLWSPQDFRLVLWGGEALSGDPAAGQILNGTDCFGLPVTSLTPRIAATTAFDSAQQVWWLFGGKDAQLSFNHDLWKGDGSEWSRVPRSISDPDRWPSARQSAAMAYDEVRQRIMLYGGFVDSGVTEENWEWDGESWHPMEFVGEHPGPRASHNLVYSSADHEMQLFGGQQNERNREEYFPDDTWVLSSRTGGPALEVAIDFQSAQIEFRNIKNLEVEVTGQGYGDVDGLVVEFWNQWAGAWRKVPEPTINTDHSVRVSIPQDRVVTMIDESHHTLHFRIRSQGVTRGIHSESMTVDQIQINTFYQATEED